MPKDKPTLEEAHIAFKPKPEKIVECLLYLLTKVEDLDQYKACKLIYLADVEHLNRFGRPITYDSIVALKKGPVPSTTYDIIKGNANGRKRVNFDDLPFDRKVEGKFIYLVNPKRAVNMKKLSESDIQILDEIIEEYAHQNFDELSNLTHEHIAYKNAWDARGQKDRVRMRVEDMIEDAPDKEDLIDVLRFTAPHIA